MKSSCWDHSATRREWNDYADHEGEGFDNCKKRRAVEVWLSLKATEASWVGCSHARRQDQPTQHETRVGEWVVSTGWMLDVRANRLSVANM